MAKRPSLEDTLARIHALRLAPAGAPEVRAELAKHLASKTNLIVARAADVAAHHKLADLEPALADAFAHFLRNAATTDKGCAAKIAIARALHALDARADAVFLPGIRHVQMEGSWGGSIDTAAELRGICAMGLLGMGHRDLMFELADLLMDHDPAARIAAARTCGATGRDDAALMLRVKSLAGDVVPDVLGECLLALIQVAPARSTPFVARFLDHHQEEVAAAAALALGAAREPAAIEILKSRLARAVTPDLRKTLLAALATARRPEAIDHLASLVESAPDPLAADALEALRPYRHDESLRARLTAAVEKRNTPTLHRALATTFAP